MGDNNMNNSFVLNNNLIQSFPFAVINEKNSYSRNNLVKKVSNYVKPLIDQSIPSVLVDYYINNSARISYISDIHIMHRLKQMNATRKEDVVLEIKSIVESIVSQMTDILLIGGDISSDYNIFRLFIEQLKRAVKKSDKDTVIFFVLGNHEFWSFENTDINKIIKKYCSLINNTRMVLLYNAIIYRDHEKRYHILTEKDLLIISNEEIRNRTRTADIIIYGGTGFSGYNRERNADIGLYHNAISREKEIKESELFEQLYYKIQESLAGKSVIVFTHMPIDCWCGNPQYQEGFVYVSGHTHENKCFDDGKTRIHACGQVGYKRRSINVRTFWMGNAYDYFFDYPDGVHLISKLDYDLFNKGKNIYVDFKREDGTLYMLKKENYYCFILKNKKEKLLILNGGQTKALKGDDIYFYFDNMGHEITSFREALDKYTKVQEKIATEVRTFGGDGHIHGCIIDIDFYNHVFFNPIDGKITAYWASDIINKVVYPNVPALLKDRDSYCYNRYKLLVKDKNKPLKMIPAGTGKEIALIPTEYKNTDIYAISGMVKKLQKLYLGVLTIWKELPGEGTVLKEKKKREKYPFTTEKTERREKLLKEAVERYGIDEDLLKEIADDNPTKWDINKNGRMTKLISSCDIDKVMAFYQASPLNSKLLMNKHLTRLLTSYINNSSKLKK